MYQIIPSEKRCHFQNDWLSSYWHFSFDHYYDPEHVSFGPLRVFNDDTIQPGKGFATHEHREMEIVTYVLEGELEHRDSTGGQGIIGPGEVQRMTAGTGIRHSEFNASQEKPVHLLQIWILPAQPNLKPEYQQRRFSPEERDGRLVPIVSGRKVPGSEFRVSDSEFPISDSSGLSADATQLDNKILTIHQDTTFYVSSIQPGQSLFFQTSRQRRVYLFLISGSLRVGGHMLGIGDAAKVTEEESILMRAEKKSDLLLIDLPY